MSRRHQHPSIIIGHRNGDFIPDVPFDPKDRGPFSYGACIVGRCQFIACLSVWLAEDLPPYIADIEERGALFVTRPIGRRVAVCELLHYLGEPPTDEGAKGATLRKMEDMVTRYVFGTKPPYTRHIPER